MNLLLEAYEDRTSTYPFLVDIVKVCEIPIDNPSKLDEIIELQEMQGRRVEIRYETQQNTN